MRSQGVPGKRKVLIPSVMALRETAMTAPLGQQGEPWAAIGRRCALIVPSRTWMARIMDGAYQRDDVGIVPYEFCIDSRN